MLFLEAWRIEVSSSEAGVGTGVGMRTKDSRSLDAIRRGGADNERALFDYGSLSPSVARFLRGQADRIRRHCASSAIQIGKALVEAKRHLSHGGFVRWVECEVGIPARTAQAYMRAASWAAGKSSMVADLPPSVLYVLSSAGVPEEFVAKILERAEAGEHIVPSAIRAELKAFRQNGSIELISEKALAANRVSSQDGLKFQSLGGDNEVSCSIAELAAFLVQKLSATDFTRVCEILTSSTVLSDPSLAQNLASAFRPALTRCFSQVPANDSNVAVLFRAGD
jgi:hypothetical protein